MHRWRRPGDAATVKPRVKTGDREVPRFQLFLGERIEITIESFARDAKEVPTTVASKREVARILRIEADSLRRHGFTDLSTHNFNCLQAQVLRENKCLGCLLGEFVPEEFRQEAFPCQHMDLSGYTQIAASPELSEKVAKRMLGLAEELEAAAKLEEA